MNIVCDILDCNNGATIEFSFQKYPAFICQEHFNLAMAKEDTANKLLTLLNLKRKSLDGKSEMQVLKEQK